MNEIKEKLDAIRQTGLKSGQNINKLDATILIQKPFNKIITAIHSETNLVRFCIFLLNKSQ